MSRFERAPDGSVRETKVHLAVTQLKSLFPEIDAASLEAHLMLERTRSVMADMRARHWTQYGITGQRFILLRLLYVAPGQRLTMGEIAAELDTGTNNTTQLVDGLVRDDLVERVASADDKRVIYAALTGEGRN